MTSPLSESVQFRVSENQRDLIYAAAEANGLGRSEFMRRAVLEHTFRLNGQGENPVPPQPTGVPAPVSTGEFPPAPDSPPATPASPDERDVPMVGASPSPPATAATDAAGLQPGPGKTCPDCGGTEGRHQSFCEQVRGEPPVTNTEQDAPEPTGSPVETHEHYVRRRVDDQLEGRNISESAAKAVAEAEWRQITSGAAPQQEPCPTCGTLKLPEAQCRDCGARPR